MAIISKKQIFLILLLPGGVLLTGLFYHMPETVEKLYSNGFYRLFASALSRIIGLVPISIAELLVQIILLAFVYSAVKYLVNLLRKSSPGTSLARTAVMLLVVVSVGYFTFLLMWGINYYRLPFADLAGLDTTEICGEELELLCIELIGQANEMQAAQDDAQLLGITYKKEVLDQAWKGYAMAGSVYSELGGRYGRPKPVMLSRVMSILGISGIYFPFTGEANVNMEVPIPLFPAAVCHEMAHQRGFAREDEANYIAYLSCLQHPDPNFKYSGTLLALINSMNALSGYDYDKYQKLKQEYSEGVTRDLAAIREFWQQFQGPVLRVSAQVNNVYLKFNNQQEGINSYGRMVDLLLAERRASRLVTSQ